MSIDLSPEAPEQPRMVRMAGTRITLASTGRPVDMQVPADITDAEAMELVAFLLRPGDGLIAQLRAQAAPAIITVPGIVLPRT